MTSIQDAHGPAGGPPSPGARRRIINTRSDQVETIPRVILRAIGALVVLSVVLVALARITGMEPAASPPVQPEARSAMLSISAGGLSEVTVRDAATGALIADLTAEEAGFIAGVHRAVLRHRMLADLPADAPVRLVQWADGRLTLIDPSTGWRAELLGFGQDNMEAFARLLD